MNQGHFAFRASRGKSVRIQVRGEVAGVVQVG